MNIQYIEEQDKQVARDKYREYRAALKVERNKQISHLATIYWQLARGRKVIDVVTAISAAGLNEQGHPKLAIAEANQQWVSYRRSSREIIFHHDERARSAVMKFPRPQTWDEKWMHARAPLPIIPPSEIPPDAKLGNLHLLWEVERWEPVPSPDPILLRRLEGPFFVVLSSWNLTQAEMAVMAAGLRM